MSLSWVLRRQGNLWFVIGNDFTSHTFLSLSLSLSRSGSLELFMEKIASDFNWVIKMRWCHCVSLGIALPNGKLNCCSEARWMFCWSKGVDLRAQRGNKREKDTCSREFPVIRRKNVDDVMFREVLSSQKILFIKTRCLKFKSAHFGSFQTITSVGGERKLKLWPYSAISIFICS